MQLARRDVHAPRTIDSAIVHNSHACRSFDSGRGAS